MTTFSNRITEEVSVGLYLLVALFSAATLVYLELNPGPYIGDAMLLIAVFWIYVCIVLATGIVVLLVNTYREFNNTPTARWAILFAGLILIGTPSGLYIVFVPNLIVPAFVVGSIGLVLAPLALTARVFEPRARSLMT